MNKLNRFTSFDNLRDALKNGIPFSNASRWDDKNDVRLVELYREITNHPNAGIICFVNDDETIYHWSYFSYGKTNDICCIELDKAALLKDYLYNEKYLCQEVQYDVLKEVCFDTPEELLFTKRHPYRFEREYRIVSLEGGRLRIEDFVRKITLSPWLNDEDFRSKRNELLVEFNLKCEINRSTLLENPEWIGKANLLKSKANLRNVCVKQYCFLKQSEKDKIDTLTRNTSSKTIECKYNTEVSMVLEAESLVAVGFLHPIIWDDIDSLTGSKLSHCFHLFKCTIKCTKDCDYELIWLTDTNRQNDDELHKLVVQSILSSHSKQKIYSVMGENDDIRREVLERNGFKMMHRNETLSDDKFVYVRK